MKYPFLPTSTAFLEEGAFWDILCTDGMRGIGVVLQLDPAGDKKRGRMFFAGVLDLVCEAIPRTEELNSVRIVAQGFAHLKAITENGGMVRGVVDLPALRIRPQIMRDIVYAPRAKAVLGYFPANVEEGKSIADYPVASTWGYGVPRRIADGLPRVMNKPVSSEDAGMRMQKNAKMRHAGLALIPRTGREK